MTNDAASSETDPAMRANDGASDAPKPRIGGTRRGASSGRLSCLGGRGKLPSLRYLVNWLNLRAIGRAIGRRRRIRFPRACTQVVVIAQQASRLPSLFTISLLARLSLFALPVRLRLEHTHSAWRQ